MAAAFKIFRMAFFFVLYFILCSALAVMLFPSESEGAQALFVICVPVLLVWWGEKRRARKIASRDQANISPEGSNPAHAGAKPDTASTELSPIQRRGVAAPATSIGLAEGTSSRGTSPVGQDKSAISHPGSITSEKLSEPSWRSDQPRTAKTRRKATTGTGWVSSSETVKVAGRDIGGMIYVGLPPRSREFGYRGKVRAYINPSLAVARKGVDTSGDGLPYWPGYFEISPQCRATYLDWLASGRADASYNPGYMFLYFYGLERRFFVDQSRAEAQEIIGEVRRLHSLYADNHSVQRYLGEFLDVAMLSETDLEEIHPAFERQGWDIPISMKYAIGARIGRGDRLCADWLLSWFMCHPEGNVRTAATRCREEFIALFRMRFDERFPDGLEVGRPRKTLNARYRAASSEFEVSISATVDGSSVPDISGLRKPVEIAQELADEAMDDLDKLSRYLGRNPEGRGSLEAQALLPEGLWDLFPSEALSKLSSWASTVVRDGGLVPVADVVERLEGARPDKLSKRNLTDAADALARIGFGLAPDPRFALRSPKIEEPVVIFELGEPIAQLEDVSVLYREALVETALNSFVVHADGQVAESERNSLLARAHEMEGLSAMERRRLVANTEWMLAVAPDMALLRRKLKDSTPAAQASIRMALIAAAHADGVIQSEEVVGIEKIYNALGLDSALVLSDLHAGDGPVRVRAADPGVPGEAIPPEPSSRALKLDAARIAMIRSDTQRVSAVLGTIFDDGASGREDARPAVLAGLDERHTALVKALIDKAHWTEESFQALCTRSGLLASGAMEGINEWAFETYDEALVEEHDGFEISPALADALVRKFKEEARHVETQAP